MGGFSPAAPVVASGSSEKFWVPSDSARMTSFPAPAPLPSLTYTDWRETARTPEISVVQVGSG